RAGGLGLVGGRASLVGAAAPPFGGARGFGLLDGASADACRPSGPARRGAAPPKALRRKSPSALPTAPWSSRRRLRAGPAGLLGEWGRQGFCECGGSRRAHAPLVAPRERAARRAARAHGMTAAAGHGAYSGLGFRPRSLPLLRSRSSVSASASVSDCVIQGAMAGAPL